MALTDNLQNYYKFNDNLNDELLTNNLSGTVSYTTGKIGNSVVLNSARITGSIGATTGNRTIEFWAYRTASANNNGSIVEIGTVGSAGFGVMIRGTGGSGITDGAIDWWVNNLHQAAADYTATNCVLDLNTWVHVVITYDGSYVYTYKNNVEVSKITFTTNPSSSTSICIGDRAGAPGNYYNGRLDETFVRGQYTTAAEVSQLYNGGNGLTYPFTIPTNTGAAFLYMMI